MSSILDMMSLMFQVEISSRHIVEMWKRGGGRVRKRREMGVGKGKEKVIDEQSPYETKNERSWT